MLGGCGRRKEGRREGLLGGYIKRARGYTVISIPRTTTSVPAFPVLYISLSVQATLDNMEQMKDEGMALWKG